MRKLTDSDLSQIIGTTVEGYHIEDARIKRGQFIDSDHYGYVLGKNANSRYVTWQFHLDENEELTVYWGHYYMEDRDAAIKDFNTRDSYDPQDEDAENHEPAVFKVKITETLQRVVEVSAENREEAEQMVSDNWRNSQYILGADDFLDVKFTVCENNPDQTGEGDDQSNVI